mmetsp:Transcript_4560/g.4551  ORF Transcript_4560/g.4551 Transcript_4560/m.4551 type:complete len:228 (-) Transcript_4560:267-950(-)
MNNNNEFKLNKHSKRKRKHCNNNNNNNNIKVSRAVHFHEEVLIRSNNELNTTTTSSTYLSSNELATIQNDIFMTFDYMNMIEKVRHHHHNNVNVNVNNGLPLYLCARGLEDYSTEHKGYLKSSTITRRQHAVYAVLQEQERQRQRKRQEQKQQQQLMMIQQNQQHHGMIYNNNNNNKIMMYDETRIRLVYEQYTLPNQNNAIAMGEYDSKEALNVYCEQQQYTLFKC